MSKTENNNNTTKPKFLNLWPTQFMEMSLPGHENANSVIADIVLSNNAAQENMTENYISQKFRLNYVLFLLSIVFFLYLLYLSIPGILLSENLQKELEEKLKKEYNLDFALSSDINYSILPKPHYSINDVVIFTEKLNYQKEFSQIKKLKIFINQNNFLKKNFTFLLILNFNLKDGL